MQTNHKFKLLVAVWQFSDGGGGGGGGVVLEAGEEHVYRNFIWVLIFMRVHLMYLRTRKEINSELNQVSMGLVPPSIQILGNC